ncbi:single-stranded-DNA-specific exonuclease RecJ [Candidatus Gracilibacteria bacterium]|nr:MAG: single-stranded-DNA-specific exonuclease RecJ [Candidatus Gracilibacteria bacterium]
MFEQISLKKNLIKYDPESIYFDIEDILEKRFENGEFIINGKFEDLHDPYMLKDMDKAVKRIKEAKQKGDRVMIFGDYDVDGVTSTSILMHFFKKIGLEASYRLPHRVKDGYGLKKYFIDEMASLSVDLVVTVDCGTKDLDVISHAKSLGIDVIVTDHHAVPDIISDEAVAIINPKRDDCNYMYKNLAGAGVAFKLVQALAYEFFDENEAEQYLKSTIDIAAIGTVADCMRLTGENRIIVQEGLRQIKNSRSLGIKKLIQDKINEDLDADIFGFLIGPRLNAAGRMDSPYKAVNLILNNGNSIDKTISEIEKLNDKRKYFTKEFVNDALNRVNKDDNIIFYISPAIEHGIIGIVAGRLTEQFYKPSIVLKDEGDKLVASCRSPEYFSMVDILTKYEDYFISFGGHKQAAGFSISKEKFAEFKTKILTEVNSLDFSKNKKQINVDKIVKLEELGFGFLNKINKYKPFGLGNEKPIFLVKNLEYEKIEFLGQGRDHLKFTTKYGFKIFAFFMGDFYEEIKRSKSPISLVFDISEDSWMGNKNLMLKVIDIILE